MSFVSNIYLVTPTLIKKIYYLKPKKSLCKEQLETDIEVNWAK